MKRPLALGILSIVFASACAPIASSVPKLSASTPRTKDSVIVEKPSRDHVKKQVKVVTSEKYEQFEKKLDSDYRVVAFDEKDVKVSELRELHAMKDLELSTTMNRLDVVVVFITKKDGKSISDEQIDDLKIEWSRTEKNLFSFEVSLEGDSGTAWSAIKGDLVAVAIAYREAKQKD